MQEKRFQKNDAETYVNPDPDYVPVLIGVSTSYHQEYSAGGTRRGKTHDIRFENIHLYGKHEPKFLFEGYDEEHKTKNVTVENIFWNGELLKEIKEDIQKTNYKVENINLTSEAKEKEIFDIQKEILLLRWHFDIYFRSWTPV